MCVRWWHTIIIISRFQIFAFLPVLVFWVFRFAERLRLSINYWSNGMAWWNLSDESIITWYMGPHCIYRYRLLRYRMAKTKIAITFALNREFAHFWSDIRPVYVYLQKWIYRKRSRIGCIRCTENWNGTQSCVHTIFRPLFKIRINDKRIEAMDVLINY